MRSKKNKRVFISYRHVSPDQRLAIDLASALETNGCTVFIDRQIAIGQKWAKEIEQQLRSTQFFVVLLSEESIRSDMLRQEVALAHRLAAQSDPALTILPVRVAFDGALPYDLGAYLDTFQYGTWQPNEPTKGIAGQLLQAINQDAPLPHAVPKRKERSSDTAGLPILH